MLTRRRYIGLLILLIAALFPTAVICFNHFGEDAFITFRYADQWLAGRGLVYNIGERVEGYSNFLWLVLLAAARRLGISYLASSRWMSVAAHGATVLALGWAAVADILKTSAGEPRRPFPLHRLWLALAVAANPYLHYHTDRGLETVFFAALIAGAAVGVGSGRWLAAGAALAGAALTRPEGIFYAAAFVPVMVVNFDGTESGGPLLCWAERAELRRRALCLLTPPLAAWATQTGFRLVYYHEWVANSVISKLGRGERPPAWSEIARWAFGSNLLPLMAVLGAPYAWRRLPHRRAWIAAALTALGAALVYQVGIGQVAATAYRYLIPAVAPTLMLIAFALEAYHLDAAGRPWRRRVVPLVLLVAAVYVPPHIGRPGTLFAGHGDARRSRFHVRVGEFLRRPDWSERWRWFQREPIMINAEAGRWLRGDLAKRYPNAALAADQMGQLGYYASHDQPIVDLIGLMDREIARKGLTTADVIRRRPTFLVLYCMIGDDQPLLPELRALVADPEFLKVYGLWYRVHPRDSIQPTGFAVWSLRGPDAPARAETVILGVDTREAERCWRVLE